MSEKAAKLERQKLAEARNVVKFLADKYCSFIITKKSESRAIKDFAIWMDDFMAKGKI